MIIEDFCDSEFYRHNRLNRPSPLFDALVDTHYFAKNRDGDFVYANPIFMEQFGFKDASELIGKKDFDIFSKEHAERFRKDDLRLMKEDGIFRNLLELVPDTKGNVQWFVTTKTPLKNPEGEIVGIEGMTRDVIRTQSSIETYSEFRRCIEFVQKNFSSTINIKHLAEMACMSISTFERRFRQHFACTPTQYIKRVRIEESCKLLLAGYPIHQAAQQSGFCDQSYFTKEFRLLMGITPRQYQKQNS
jgi:PAS domain S-box-containing protein